PLTVALGLVKPPMDTVTLPTDHMARAPTREPSPLSVPAAVETWVLESSWAMVKYIEVHVPRPKLTPTKAVTADHGLAMNGTMAHRLTRIVAVIKMMRRAVSTEKYRVSQSVHAPPPMLPTSRER